MATPRLLTLTQSVGRTALTALLALSASSCGGSLTNETPAAAEDAATAPSRVAEVSLAEWPRVKTGQALDPDVEARIDDILPKLSLEQKVGQVIQADSGSVSPADVKTYRLGSVLSGGNSAVNGQAYATAEDWLADADAYFEASVDADGVEIAVPVIWGIDAVHGHNNVVGGTLFPHNIALGATDDPDLVRRIGEAVAIELRATGHDWTFAPTLAVPQDDRWGRTYEGFSEDPAVVARYAAAIVEGLQGAPGDEDFLRGAHVIATAKHFVGDGGTDGGRDQGDARISEATMRDVHAAGYPPALEAGVRSVMASFSSWNGRKVHGRHDLLTGVLKDRMGFSGFVVGDWNAHGQIPGCSNESCAQAINAGVDMFMAPDSWRGLYDATLAQARSGEISMSRLDDAVRRILRVKIAAGLFDAPKPSERAYADPALVGADAHRALAREAVRKSLVLLKNNGGLLPLPADGRILVAGDGADDVAKQAGGWTLTWQGGGLDRDLFPNAETVFEAIDKATAAAGGEAVLSVDGAYDETPDAAIVVFGENPYAEFQGDVPHLSYGARRPDDAAILRKLSADGVPTVGVFLTGRALWTNPEINAADAFVVAWLPGGEGGGVADVLLAGPDGEARHDFVGRLPYSWPATPTAFDINGPNAGPDALFPIGHGLTLADTGDLDPLPEDAALPAEPEGGALFARGRLAPGAVFAAGPSLNAAVELELPSDANGDVAIELVDVATQDDAALIEWAGPGVALVRAPAPKDYAREANADVRLAVDLLIDGDANDLGVGLSCGGDACARFVSAANAAGAADDDAPVTVSVALSCFRDAGVNMSAIEAPLILRAEAPMDATLVGARLVQADGAEGCPALSE